MGTVTAAQLAAYIDMQQEQQEEGGLVVVEVVSPAEAAASPARVPGSHRVWRPQYELPLTAKQPLGGLVPSQQAFQEFARGLGINEDSMIVILDRKYDATRLWWLFLLYGHCHELVRVLDGGYQAWVAAGLPTSTRPAAAVATGRWTARPANQRILSDRSQVVALRGGVGERDLHHLWDVRSVAEHTGSTTLPGAAQPGRIPWTRRRLEWDMFRNAPSPGNNGTSTWKSAAEIAQLAHEYLGATLPSHAEQEQAQAPTTTHTFYCQSGVRTTQIIFGMARAGWPLEYLRNYDGSWVEWSHVATADEIVVDDNSHPSGNGAQQEDSTTAISSPPLPCLALAVIMAVTLLRAGQRDGTHRNVV